MTWDALNQAGQNYGAPDIDYDRFAARWESDPVIKKLVARFDGQGVVINTKGEELEPEQGKPKPNKIHQSAMNAVSDKLK
jgi:hypothetical protein